MKVWKHLLAKRSHTENYISYKLRRRRKRRSRTRLGYTAWMLLSAAILLNGNLTNSMGCRVNTHDANGTQNLFVWDGTLDFSLLGNYPQNRLDNIMINIHKQGTVMADKVYSRIKCLDKFRCRARLVRKEWLDICSRSSLTLMSRKERNTWIKSINGNGQ